MLFPEFAFLISFFFFFNYPSNPSCFTRVTECQLNVKTCGPLVSGTFIFSTCQLVLSIYIFYVCVHPYVITVMHVAISFFITLVKTCIGSPPLKFGTLCSLHGSTLTKHAIHWFIQHKTGQMFKLTLQYRTVRIII